MEWLLALLATALTASYTIALGRGIERRKRWALEMARAIAMLNPSSADRYLFEDLKAGEEAVERLAREEEQTERSNRLAA